MRAGGRRGCSAVAVRTFLSQYYPVMTDTSGGEDTEEEAGSDLEQSFYSDTSRHLYLFIETLTGTSFEMKVSPLETIVCIKAKLQQLEGIPISQQHLLYSNRELSNNSTLYECDIPDGATLRLVLSMRGGPINTRKIPLHDEHSRELQDAVERSKEELLEQIPEGGHVTVLVFRDGDQINLYHVLERPDGSYSPYSPLSDSWSGTSIKNLFAEPDDPEVQERLRENAHTMSKMQEIRSKLQDQTTRKQQPSVSVSPTQTAQHGKMNLPPINPADLSLKNEFKPGALQSRRIRPDKREFLPKVNRRKSTVDFPESPVHTLLDNKTFDKNNADHGPSPVTSYEHSNMPTMVKNKKLISIDEMNKNVDENKSFTPSLLSSNNLKRLRKTYSGRRNVQNTVVDERENEESDYQLRERTFPSTPVIPSLLTSSTNKTRQENSNKSLKNKPETVNLSDSLHVPYLSLEKNDVTNKENESKGKIDLSFSDPVGLERRLLHSRRGRLIKPLAEQSRKKRVLASPKLHSPQTPQSGKLRPSYQTRPLSGPKRKKTGRLRCGGADCRKKLNITNSFSCRCERSFCPLHRHPESHGCTHDFKTEGRKLLEAANPMVSLPKLPKI